MDVRQRFAPLPAGFDPPAPFWDALAAGYAHPPRAYHTLEHAVAVAREVAAVPGWRHPLEVYAAALFHDVVYEVGRSDNEARSASVAQEAVERWVPGVDADRVGALIATTAHHGHLAPGDVDPETARFLDADLSILAARARTYALYVRGVRQEYLCRISDAEWRAGRSTFLRRLLGEPRIYLSEPCHALLDEAARDNVAAELALLHLGADGVNDLVFRVHAAVVDRIDFAAVGSLDRQEMARQLASEARRAAEELVPPGTRAAAHGIAEAVLDEILGLGPLEPLLRDPDVTAIDCGPAGTTFERRSFRTPAARGFRDRTHLLGILVRIADTCVREGLAERAADGTVRGITLDGTRFHADPREPHLTLDRPAKR